MFPWLMEKIVCPLPEKKEKVLTIVHRERKKGSSTPPDWCFHVENLLVTTDIKRS